VFKNSRQKKGLIRDPFCLLLSLDLASFEQACRTHAATDTHANDAVFLFTSLQFTNDVAS
jgi:hypothetical protein